MPVKSLDYTTGRHPKYIRRAVQKGGGMKGMRPQCHRSYFVINNSRFALLAVLLMWMCIQLVSAQTAPPLCPTATPAQLAGSACQIGTLVFTFSPTDLATVLLTPDQSGPGFTLSQIPTAIAAQVVGGVEFSVQTASGSSTITGWQVSLNGASLIGGGDIIAEMLADSLALSVGCVSPSSLPPAALFNCSPAYFSSPLSQILADAFFQLDPAASVTSIHYQFFDTCDLGLPDSLYLSSGGTYSRSGQPTSVFASFILPSDATIKACKFTGFNWQQHIVLTPPPPTPCLVQSVVNGILYWKDRCLSTIENPDVPPIPPFLDPPSPGGYVYFYSYFTFDGLGARVRYAEVGNQPYFVGAYPFYYSPTGVGLQTKPIDSLSPPIFALNF